MPDDTRNRRQVLARAKEVLARAPEDARRQDEHGRLAASVGAWEAGTTGSAADRVGFVPRDPQIALLQARLDADPPPPTTLIGRVLDGLLRLLPARWYDRMADGFHLSRGVDPEWAKAYWELGDHLAERKAFREPGRPEPVELAERARVVLVGDWGTGLEFARRVSQQIETWIADAGGRETHVVHLGDVYYAGTEWEATHRFLAYWPVNEGQDVASWCLNGNHDMYAAGTGLFDVILADPRFRRQRTRDGSPTSEFHLRNRHWQILGLDTSWRYDSADVGGAAGHLDDDQVAWLADAVGDGDGGGEGGDDPGPRTILLSHHPAVTSDGRGAREPVNALLTATAPVLARRRVAAWFWGHRHRLIVHRRTAELGIDYAVCTGHGAIPETPDPAGDEAAARAGLEERFTTTYTDDEDDVWYRCGFTVLDIDGDRIEVTYVDMTGETWTASPTVLPTG